ncbi:hypothetical protein NX059_010356 [Plenodomus lindquistii]|nr:hypothetical protein NX059_010356 [Plenodomus lindquistii]
MEDNEMYHEQEQGNSPIFEDPFSAALRPEISGPRTFTTRSHIHSNQGTSVFTLNRSPFMNEAVRPINRLSFQPQQLTTAATAQTLGITSRLNQSTFRSQMRKSPQKVDPLPGLGQTGNAYQAYISSTPRTGHNDVASVQGLSGNKASAPPIAFKNNYAEMSEKFGKLTTKTVDSPDIAKQQLQPRRDIVEDLKRLLKREIDATPRTYPPVSTAFKHSQSLPLMPSQLGPYTTTSSYEHAPIMPPPSSSVSPVKSYGIAVYEYAQAMPMHTNAFSPTKFTSPSPSPTKFNAPAQTPTRFNEGIRTPTKFNEESNTPTSASFPATSRRSTGKSRGRHHRTATPEQRTIREMMGGKPVFTVGMKEQDDRCLFFDFFEQIKQWASNYTVDLRSLNAEQIHGLASHHLLAGPLGDPSNLTMLITEKDMLTTMVTSIISRHIVQHALDEHSLLLSNHPQAPACEQLAYHWSLLPATAHTSKHNLLLTQQHLYTTIKDDPNHRAWRAATSSHLAFTLLTSLSSLLATNLAPAAQKERNHTLTELYVKGYRIGFRLRMAPHRWSFAWPASGAEFNPFAMVNENRLLYGEILRTMTAVMQEPGVHEVRFAVSPTVARSGFAGGREERVLVHHAMVNITRKGCV